MFEPTVLATADLFKALSSPGRLELMRVLIEDASSDVSSLTERTGMSQPLVSQHLRTLRLSGLVEAERVGRHAVYRITDEHVAHIVDDAIAHVAEDHGSGDLVPGDDD